MNKKLFMPLLVGTVVFSMGICFLCWLIQLAFLPNLKTSYDSELLPLLVVVFQKVSWIGWIIPAICGVVGAMLMMRKYISPVSMAWFVSLSLVCSWCWCCLAGVAVFIYSMSFRSMNSP